MNEHLCLVILLFLIFLRYHRVFHDPKSCHLCLNIGECAIILAVIKMEYLRLLDNTSVLITMGGYTIMETVIIMEHSRLVEEEEKALFH